MSDAYEFVVGGEIGPVVRRALAGLPVTVDRRARQVVEVRSVEPAVVWSMLDRLSERGWEWLSLRPIRPGDPSGGAAAQRPDGPITRGG
jgi:hypothetical protein